MLIRVVLVGVVLVAALLGYRAWTAAPTQLTWAGTSIPCLPNGHQNLSLHIHPTLHVVVDGTPELIPANIGISASCMAEIHTHDASGTIHIESANAGHDHTLGEFFEVWGKSFDRDGYTSVMTVEGTASTAGIDLPLKDDQHIVLTYTKNQ